MLDYTSGGYWHVTICVDGIRPLLGRLVDQSIEPSGLGRLVETELLDLPKHYSGLTLDCYCLMPDHLHVLFFLNGLDPQRPDLRRVVQRFKSTASGKYVLWRNARGLSKLPEKLFQRSFRDSYIKDERHLEAVREYILRNPMSLHLKGED